MKLYATLAFMLVLLLSGGAYATQNFSGTYTLNAQGTVVTLVLDQDQAGNITGNLSSSSGIRYQIEGMIQDDAAVGGCYNEQGGVYFEARFQAEQLLFALIEPDANNMPDYNRARQLMFVRQGGSPAPPPAGNRPSVGQGSAPAMGQQKAPPLSDTEATDPNWGYSFRIPQGWKIKKNYNGAVLGHDSIAGMILIITHTAASLQEVVAQLQSGMSDEGIQLTPQGQLSRLGDNVLYGEYTGVAQGTPVKARGFGTFSPYGGGAYIIALSTPEKYSAPLYQAAEAVAKGMHYRKVESSNLMQMFAGTWVSVTRNTQYTVTLHPDGTYNENYEASYSGQFNNQYGDLTGNWGNFHKDQDRGRWSIRGNRREGTLILTESNGSTSQIPYRVHVDKGETYWREYLFGGTLYQKQ